MSLHSCPLTALLLCYSNGKTPRRTCLCSWSPSSLLLLSLEPSPISHFLLLLHITAFFMINNGINLLSWVLILNILLTCLRNGLCWSATCVGRLLPGYVPLHLPLIPSFFVDSPHFPAYYTFRASQSSVFRFLLSWIYIRTSDDVKFYLFRTSESNIQMWIHKSTWIPNKYLEI